MTSLTHLDEAGRARMVDVSGKEETLRIATASARLLCAAETIERVREGTTPKGAVVSTAELAGVMAAKQTANLIPLCHPLPLTKVAVTIELNDALPGFEVTAEARTRGRTGVEMEALTATTVACLTLFDMLKAIDRGLRITDVSVTGKSGGKSGDWSTPA